MDVSHAAINGTGGESNRNATLRQRYEFDACLTRRMTSAMQQQRG